MESMLYSPRVEYLTEALEGTRVEGFPHEIAIGNRIRIILPVKDDSSYRMHDLNARIHELPEGLVIITPGTDWTEDRTIFTVQCALDKSRRDIILNPIVERPERRRILKTMGLYVSAVSRLLEVRTGDTIHGYVALGKPCGTLSNIIGMTAMPRGVLLVAVETLRENGGVIWKGSGSLGLGNLLKPVPTRRRTVSKTVDGMMVAAPEEWSSGLSDQTDENLKLAAPTSMEHDLARMLPMRTIYELRARENRLRTFTKDFPEEMKTVDLSELSKARSEHAMIEDVAKAVGLDAGIVKAARGFYGLKMPKGLRSEMTKHQMISYRERTGNGSPAAERKVRAKIAETNKQRYGVENVFSDPRIQQRIRQTMKERYGCESPLQSSEIQRKFQKTMIERYGAPTTLQSSVLKEKILKTNLERYGSENPTSNEIVKQKIQDTNMKRRGMPYAGRDEIGTSRRHSTNLERYGVEEVMQSPEIRSKAAHSARSGTGLHKESSYEQKVQKILTEAGLDEGEDFVTNTHSVIDSELDFYIPGKKLAIEVSPIWTHHSNISTPTDAFIQPKPRNYHRRKHLETAKQDIELITLLGDTLEEPMWSNLTEPFLKMKVSGKASKILYGREVEIAEAKTARQRSKCIQFCRENHMRGTVKSKHWFSVLNKHNDEMVGVFSLSPKGDKTSQTLEIKRVCWKSGVQVRFGLSKIVSYIRRNFSSSYGTLESFSANDMGLGASYEKTGFTFIKETKPSLRFFNCKHPEDSYSWSVATTWGARQGVIAEKLGSQELSDKEARIIVETRLPHRVDSGAGYHAVYDSGNRLWSMDL